MSNNEQGKNECVICNIPFHMLVNSTNEQICQTCKALFQINMKPSLKKSLQLLRTITVEGNGFVEIDGEEFIVEGTSGLGYRFQFQNPFKMSVECYRSKDAALNSEDELCLHPCIDLDDESVELPIGDLVFTYAMTLTNDMECAEEIETLEECILIRDAIAPTPTKEEWNYVIEKRRNDAERRGFGGPFPVDEEELSWFCDDFDFPENFEPMDDVEGETNESNQNSSDDDAIVAGLSRRSQERIDRFILDLDRY